MMPPGEFREPPVTESPRLVRLITGYGAIVSALPYLALKIVWLSGGSLGATDRAIMQERSMVALNATTAGMDVVGIALAFAFTYRWGFRIPAWLLLPPMWVASGLLARFVIGVPMIGIVAVVAPGLLPRVTAGLVQPWVYLLVYLEFAGLGTGLMLSFVLYAKRRWPHAFQSASDVTHTRAAECVHRALAHATAPVAMAIGMLHLAWALGATWGLSERAAASRTIFGVAINAIDGWLAMGAALGVLAIVHRRRTPASTWLPVSIAWLGTASLFAWGLWPTVNVLGQTALMRGTEATAFVHLVGLARLIVGLILGQLLLQLLAARDQTESRTWVEGATAGGKMRA